MGTETAPDTLDWLPEAAEDVRHPDIPVSSEMIRAGLKTLASYDSSDLPEWKVVDVYCQMELARRALKADQGKNPDRQSVLESSS